MLLRALSGWVTVTPTCPFVGTFSLFLRWEICTVVWKTHL